MQAGDRFARLVLVGPSDKRASTRERLWVAVCDCGTERLVRPSVLKRGDLKSCGCLRKDLARINGRLYGGLKSKRASNFHGPTHASWEGLRRRCNNPASDDYSNYGGRGITVCERWNSYAAFLADMGERPAGTTIDRIDTNGNYEPDNCRWATGTEQARNRRSNRVIEFDGESMPMAAWADRFGISSACILGRLKSGWSMPEIQAGRREGRDLSSRTEKRCWRCTRTLPLTSFGKSSSKADGHQSTCKECAREYSAQRSTKQREAATRSPQIQP